MEVNEQGGKAPINDMMGQGGEDLSPELKEKMDVYIMALMHIVHSDKTAGGIVEMLKSAPPDKSIPFTSIEVNKLVEKSLDAKGKKVDDSIKMAGAMYLTADLMEVGNATKSWDTPVSEEQLPTFFQTTLTEYIKQGVKGGSIDPVELQAQTEPLLNDKQRKVGTTAAASMGLPHSPTAEMGIDASIQKKTRPLEEENKKLKGILSQQPQGGGPNGI